jgi:hypothetical protein
MKPTTLMFLAITLALVAFSWIIHEGFQYSAIKAQIAADAKVRKAEEGNKFRFGIMKKGE